MLNYNNGLDYTHSVEFSKIRACLSNYIGDKIDFIASRRTERYTWAYSKDTCTYLYQSRVAPALRLIDFYRRSTVHYCGRGIIASISLTSPLQRVHLPQKALRPSGPGFESG